MFAYKAFAIESTNVENASAPLPGVPMFSEAELGQMFRVVDLLSGPKFSDFLELRVLV